MKLWEVKQNQSGKNYPRCALAERPRGTRTSRCALGGCRPGLALRARNGLHNINSGPPVSLSSSRKLLFASMQI
jgi:hypothetical protein